MRLVARVRKPRIPAENEGKGKGLWDAKLEERGTEWGDLHYILEATPATCREAEA